MLKANVHLSLKNEASTQLLAQRFAKTAQPGAVLLLSGPIGAGKTFFARAFIRAYLNSTEDIPSPTFTLVQTYEGPIADIWHCDLYRLTNVDDVLELGLDEAFQTAVCLIEWPDRLGTARPKDTIDFEFFAESDGSHSVIISGLLPPELSNSLKNA